MKLDGELAFCCPSIGLEPESHSFKFSDNSPDSMGCKSRDQKGKENEKKVSIDLKKNEGNLVPTKYDREEDDGLIESKLVSHMGKTDLENDEAKVRNFVEPVPHSSQYTKSPNAKRSPNVSIPDPPEELYSYETLADIYLEECVTEREPELIVCCKESNYHFIKDICVDEGVPANDKVLFANSVDEKAVLKILPFDPYENNESEKDYTRINGPFPAVLDLAVTEESDKVSAKHHQSEDLMGREENATEKLADQNKEMVFPGDKIFLQELDTEQTRPSPHVSDEDELIHAEVCSKPELCSKLEESENRIEEAVLASPAMDKIDSDILVSDSNLVLSASVACCSKEECHQDDGCKFDVTQNTFKPEDGNSIEQAITSQVYYSLGESSFSAVGPVSSHISYSGPVSFNGSISLRSDSSTTSARSFAFPVLQSEWNSSPVRMAKADRRHYQKRKGWRQGLFCCRF